MKFNLRKPCSACPLRSDQHPFFGRDARGYARAREWEAELQENFVLPCHKTAGWDDDGHQVQTDRTHACAGALITMEKGEGMGNLARIAARLGLYDPTILDLDAPTYASLKEWAEAHRPGGGSDA